MASAGLLPGMVTCLFSAAVAAFGLYLLSLCATKAPHRKASFFAISELTFPRAAIFFDAAIAIKCFGVSIRYVKAFSLGARLRSEFGMTAAALCSYLIIIKGLIPNVVAALYHDLASSSPPAWSQSGQNWITIIMIFLAPLCFLRKIDSLRHTSYVALFSVGERSSISEEANPSAD